MASGTINKQPQTPSHVIPPPIGTPSNVATRDPTRTSTPNPTATVVVAASNHIPSFLILVNSYDPSATHAATYNTRATTAAILTHPRPDERSFADEISVRPLPLTELRVAA
jgi:hypothetical protein